jgi:hypothetical protein
MIAKLEFNLLDVDDKQAYLRCVKASDMANVLWKFTRNSRKKLENREYLKDSDVFDGIEATFEELFRLLEEQNINIDELVE